MPIYQFTVRAKKQQFAELLLRLNEDAVVLTAKRLSSFKFNRGLIDTDADTQTIPEDKSIHGLVRNNLERNQEIIDKYVSDPKQHSSVKLAEEYGLSRERICQILRRPNVIEHVKERKRAVQGAYDSVQAEIAAKAKQEFDELIERGLVLVREGQSVRQAVIALGIEPKSTFANLLNKAARAQGLRRSHGRHRDMSERKARIKELYDRGHSIPEIVQILRANGSDPHLHPAWIYNHMPECKVYTRVKKEQQS